MYVFDVIMWIVLLLLGTALFLAGRHVGKRQAAAKSVPPDPAVHQRQDRAGLAEAWQQGFDAATLHLAGPLSGQDSGPPSVQEQASETAGRHVAAGQPTAGHRADGHPAGVGLSTPGAEEHRAGSLPPNAHMQPFPQPVPPLVPQPVRPPVQVQVEPSVPVDPRVRTLRNINITLYVAALMLVAAASLFISLALPATAKVLGLGMVTAGFYVAGLVLHARSERLRPAAAAFCATGLALIPMTGLAHYLLLSNAPGVSWFATSVVGTAAFVYAAGRLQSKIVAGLATTFLVSTAYAGGAVLNRGLIYYFLFSMLLAMAITLLGFKKPRWVDNIYVQSFTLAHRYLVPATVLAALLSLAVLDAVDYGWLFAAATFYYAVALLAGPEGERFRHLAAARVAVIASLGAFLHAGDVSLSTTMRMVAAVLILQLVVLAYLAPVYAAKVKASERFVRAEVLVWLAAAALSTVLGAEGLLAVRPPTGGPDARDLNWALALLLVAGLLLGGKLGGVFRWTPLGTAALGIVEPLVGNQGRQGVLIAAAVIATWWLAHKSAGAGELALRWAARFASVVGVGALFSFGAAGWVLEPRFAGSRQAARELYVPGAAALEQAVEVAALVGVLLALLVQVVLATVHLRRLREIDAALPASADRPLRVGGEALVFAGAMLGAALAAGAMSMQLAWNDYAALVAVDPGSVGWSTRLWLTYPWDTIALWPLLFIGLLGATGILGYRRSVEDTAGESPRPALGGSPTALVHLGGLIALVAALGISVGQDPAWMVELVALLGLGHAGVRLLAATEVPAKIGYLVLAQVLFSAAAWHMADRFAMDGHGQAALFAVTLAVPQSLRVFLGRNADTKKFGDPRTLIMLAALGWQALIPLSYVAAQAGAYDQASLMVQFLCLLFFAGVLAIARAGRETIFIYASIPAALGLLGLVLVPALGAELRVGGWLPAPLWTRDAAGIVLVALLLGLLAIELRNVLGRNYRWAMVVVALSYWVALLGLHEGTDPGWRLIAWVLGAAGIAVFAATWGVPLLLLGSAVLVFLASLRTVDFVRVLAGQRGSEPLDTMLGFGATTAVLLVAAIFGGRFGAAPAPLSTLGQRLSGWAPAHARVLFAAALASLALGGLLGLADHEARYVYAGAALLLVAALAAAAVETPVHRRETGYVIAALVGAAAIHRCWWIAVGGTSAFAASYYWIVVLALLAAYEFLRKCDRNGTVVLAASAGLTSITGLGTLLSSTLAQQLVVLLTFTALLVFGLLGNRKIFTVWGAVGVAAAVLWFLRGYTFLLLLVIAIALIALALWRLGKMNKGPAHAAEPTPGRPGADHAEAEDAVSEHAGLKEGAAEESAADEAVPNQSVPHPEAAEPHAAMPQQLQPSLLPWMRAKPRDPREEAN